MIKRTVVLISLLAIVSVATVFAESRTLNPVHFTHILPDGQFAYIGDFRNTSITLLRTTPIATCEDGQRIYDYQNLIWVIGVYSLNDLSVSDRTWLTDGNIFLGTIDGVIILMFYDFLTGRVISSAITKE